MNDFMFTAIVAMTFVDYLIEYEENYFWYSKMILKLLILYVYIWMARILLSILNVLLDILIFSVNLLGSLAESISRIAGQAH